jgi:hypothetical protein
MIGDYDVISRTSARQVLRRRKYFVAKPVAVAIASAGVQSEVEVA